MRRRCHYPRDVGYALYGGRGIVVCDRWRDSFATFLADMGERPSRRHSIDRIDPNGNYEPGNCRWATTTEQQTNKRAITQCRRGHAFTPENTYITRTKRGRVCRACVNEKARAVRAQRRTTRASRHEPTHCARGHEFNEANTLHYSERRLCRTCHNERARRWRAQRRT